MIFKLPNARDSGFPRCFTDPLRFVADVTPGRASSGPPLSFRSIDQHGEDQRQVACLGSESQNDFGAASTLAEEPFEQIGGADAHAVHQRKLQGRESLLEILLQALHRRWKTLFIIGDNGLRPEYSIFIAAGREGFVDKLLEGGLG